MRDGLRDFKFLTVILHFARPRQAEGEAGEIYILH